MGRLLNVIIEQLKIWDNSTDQFCNVLDDCTRKLQNDPSVAEIKEIIAQVVTEAEHVRQSNKSMHSALQGLTNEIHELREDVERLGCEAVTDSLTKITNRRGFDNELKRLTKEAKATGKDCCLLMIDVDHFKNINDNFGHLVGDKVLKFIATTLLKQIRGNDKVARFGGEEFAVILPNTNEDGAIQVAENLRAAVSARQLTTGSNSRPIGRITISVGVALYRPDEDEETLISRADQCMYAAKHGGRNQVKSESMIKAVG
jgi:diguanylate cyclase